MPSKIYLSSGDEFTVAESYATVLAKWSQERGLTSEFTGIWWTHVDHADEDWPAYREAPITVVADSIVAVERVDGPHADAIDQARQLQRNRD